MPEPRFNAHRMEGPEDPVERLRAALHDVVDALVAVLSTSVPDPESCPDGFLTTDETAALLRVPVATLYDWRSRRRGPAAVKVGRHLRFRRGDVESWLATAADAPA